VLLDAFYPGWTAKVDGSPARIVRANGFFRAVEVGPEDSTVEFVYRPRRFYAGLLVAGAALVLCAVVLLKRRADVLWVLGLATVFIVVPMEEGGTTAWPVAALRILVLAMAAGWAFRLGTGGGESFYRTRLDLWALGLWLLAAVSVLRSDYFFISSYWLIQIATYMLLFFFLVQFTAGESAEAKRRTRWTLGLMVAAAVIQSVIALGQSVQASSIEVRGFRASGGYFNPSMMAGALMVVGPYTLARLFWSLRKGWSGVPGALGWGAIFLAIAVGVGSTVSRASVIWPVPLGLVLAWGLANLIELRGVERGRAWKRAAGWTAAAAVVMSFTLLIVPNPIRDRLFGAVKDPFAFERVNIWKSGLEMAADHPTGVGLGMYKYHSHRYRFPVEGVMAGRYERNADTAHNEYIHLAAEMSPLAPLALMGALTVLLLAAGRALWRGGGNPTVVGAAAGLVAVALHALVDSNLHNPSIAVLAAAMAAVLAAELSRSGEGLAVRLGPTPAGLWLVRLALAVLLLAGGQWFYSIARAHSDSLAAMDESDPAVKERTLTRLMPKLPGYAPHSKALANARWKMYVGTRNVKYLELAIKAAEWTIETNPADPAGHRLRGQYMLSLHQVSRDANALKAARRSFMDSYERSPFDIEVSIGLAWTSRFEGNKAEEIKWWENAVLLEPHDLMSRAYLTRALAEAGHVVRAREQWREFHRRFQETRARLARDPGAFYSFYQAKRTSVDRDTLVFIEEKYMSSSPGDGAGDGEGSGP